MYELDRYRCIYIFKPWCSRIYNIGSRCLKHHVLSTWRITWIDHRPLIYVHEDYIYLYIALAYIYIYKPTSSCFDCNVLVWRIYICIYIYIKHVYVYINVDVCVCYWSIFCQVYMYIGILLTMFPLLR